VSGHRLIPIVPSAEGGSSPSAPIYVILVPNPNLKSFAVFGSVAGVAKASAGNLMSISASNSNAATRYLQIFDQNIVPILNDIPVLEWQIVTSAQILVGYDFLNGKPMSGIAWGVSTTSGSYTAATAAQHNVEGTYI